jgi:hypothetical protein
MVKCGLDFFDFFLRRKPFSTNSFYFIEMRPFLQSYKYTNKNGLLPAWRDFKKNMGYADMKYETLSHIPF